MSQNPMFALLGFRRRTRTWDLALISAVAIAALAGVARGPMVMAWVFALVFPCVRAVVDSLALGSLSKGGCLEELIASHTSPAEMLDGVAAFSWRSSIGPVALMGCLSALLATLQSQIWGHTMASVLACGFIPFLALVVLLPVCYVSLLFQAVQLCGRIPRGWQPWLGWVAFATLVLVWPNPGTPLVVLGLVGWGLRQARLDTIEILSLGVDQRRATRFQTRPNSWVRSSGRGPIALREQSRESRSTPWGLVGAILRRHGICLGLVSLLYLHHGFTPSFGWALLLLALVLQPLRAALRLRLAVLQEREAASFEVLGLTRLQAEEFVDGWARVGFGPLLFENLSLLSLAWLAFQFEWFLDAFICLGPPNPRVYGLFLLAVLLPIVGAYVGLWSSAMSTNRGQAAGNTLAMLLAFLGAIAVWSVPLYSLAHPLFFAFFVTVLGGATAYFLRARCLALLKVEDAPENLVRPGVYHVDLVDTAPDSDGTVLLVFVIIVSMLLPFFV